MPRLSIILASLCAARAALVAKDKDHYVRYWARNRDKGRCNAKHCEFFRDFGPIDVGCQLEVDRVGLKDETAPAFSLALADGRKLLLDARDASSITRFKARPALCEYGNATSEVALLMVAHEPAYLFRNWGPFLNKLLFATDARVRPLLWIGDMTRGVRDCSTSASAGPPGGECSAHAVKMPATLAALADPTIKGLYHLDLDTVVRYPWTISRKELLQEHRNGHSAVAFSTNGERFGRLRWQVKGDRYYARDSTIARAFIGNWFNNRCMFKDDYVLWHTVLEFAVKEGCVDDPEGEMYRMRYGDVSRVTDGTTKLILDCAVIDARCPRFPFSNVGGHTCDTRLPRLLDDVQSVSTDVRLLGIEERDRTQHPWENTARKSWANLDVGACATPSHLAASLGPVKTVVVYSGPTDLGNQLYLDNFDYFLQNGLPSSRGACVPGVAVILVLTTETLAHYAGCLRAYNATCGELRTITRVNRCYDMESARLALSTDESFRRLGLGAAYEKVVFVNCGMLGPLLPDSDRRFWASHFTDRIDARVKLVSPTINCGGKRDVHHAHVQSMLWATDKIGLSAIRASGAIYDCGNELRGDLIARYELGLSRAVLRAGYAIQDMTNRTFDWREAQKAKCEDMWEDRELVGKYDPGVLGFWKVSRSRQAGVMRSWLGSGVPTHRDDKYNN